MGELFWIITALLLAIVMLILLICIYDLNQRLEVAEEFIHDAFPILVPLWLERDRNQEDCAGLRVRD